MLNYRTILSQVFRHWLLQQTVVALPADNTFAALASAKEKIQDKTYNRKEKQYQYPRHSLDRITIVENDDDNRTDNGPEIEYIKGYCCYLTEYIGIIFLTDTAQQI